MNGLVSRLFLPFPSIILGLTLGCVILLFIESHKPTIVPVGANCVVVIAEPFMNQGATLKVGTRIPTEFVHDYNLRTKPALSLAVSNDCTADNVVVLALGTTLLGSPGKLHVDSAVLKDGSVVPIKGIVTDISDR
jgi:hypothetical protein